MNKKELRIKLSRLESKAYNLHFEIGVLIGDLDREEKEQETKQ